MSRIASILGRDLRERLDRDAAALPWPPTPRVVTEDAVAALPAVVQRYFSFMGAVGRPEVTSFRAHLSGRFRMRQQQGFMPAEIWQYNTVDPIARLFWMRIDVAGVVPMVGRDSYRAGEGRMLGKLLDTVTVADGSGEPFDVGELTTWLNDAVMMAPSMLLRAGATFAEIDDTAFDVSLTDAGRTVRARVHLDERGAPVDFRSDDRFADLPSGPVRALWSTPIEGWQRADGRALPTRGSAVWHLPDGQFTYGVMDFDAGHFQPDPVLGRPAARRRPTRQGPVDTLTGAAGIAAMLVGSPVLRGRYNRWGATDDECRTPMPGDDLVPEPRMESTRAITVDAPPEAVWPWLVQIGQGRGGLYSYDALENLVGLDIHSADAVLPAHQHLEPGDVVRLGKPGSPCFAVVSADPGRSLVMVGADPATGEAVPTPVRDGTGATWQWELRGVHDGSATRLLSRQRNTHPDDQAVLWRVVEPIGFVMERRMLIGIRDRAERDAPARR